MRFFITKKTIQSEERLVAGSIKLFITGKMGSGKDSAALWFESKYGAERWTRTDLMKRLAHSLIDHVDNPDQYLERLFPDPEERDAVREELLTYVQTYQPESGKARRLYQDVTEICQKYDPYCFERELDARISLVEDVNFSLVDDVRKLSAFEYFKEKGYMSLRIEANEKVRRQRMLERDGFLPGPEAFAHSSEVELDGVEHDFVVVNEEDDPTKLINQLQEVSSQIGLESIPKEEIDIESFSKAIKLPRQ